MNQDDDILSILAEQQPKNYLYADNSIFRDNILQNFLGYSNDSEVFMKQFFGDEYKSIQNINYQNILDNYDTLRKSSSRLKNDNNLLKAIEAVEKLQQEDVTDFSLSQLPLLFNKYNLRHILSTLKLETLIDKFGEYIIYYCYFSTFVEDDFYEKILDYIEYKSKFVGNRDLFFLLQKSQKIGGGSFPDKDFFTFIKQFVLFGSLDGYIKTLNAQSKDQQYAFYKTSGDNAIGLERYDRGLEWVDDELQRKSINNKHFKIYLDAPVGIGLLHNGEPSCVMSFFILDKDTLIINQIQKNAYDEYNILGQYKGYKTDQQLDTFDWQKKLLEQVEKIATFYGCTKIAIQGARNNRWIHKLRGITGEEMKNLPLSQHGKDHLNYYHAEKIYDKFAKKNGFELSHQDNNRYKSV